MDNFIIDMDNFSGPKSLQLSASAKICGRCGCSFQCNADDIASCACSGVEIPGKVIEDIQSCYNDCLCPTCLMALAQQHITAPDE